MCMVKFHDFEQRTIPREQLAEQFPELTQAGRCLNSKQPEQKEPVEHL